MLRLFDLPLKSKTKGNFRFFNDKKKKTSPREIDIYRIKELLKDSREKKSEIDFQLLSRKVS